MIIIPSYDYRCEPLAPSCNTMLFFFFLFLFFFFQC
jgi:hypothetical protein